MSHLDPAHGTSNQAVAVDQFQIDLRQLTHEFPVLAEIVVREFLKAMAGSYVRTKRALEVSTSL